jgi:hypothetical protein
MLLQMLIRKCSVVLFNLRLGLVALISIGKRWTYSEEVYEGGQPAQLEDNRRR